MAEKVLSYLGMAEGLHVFFGAVDTTAGFVEADYADVFRGIAGGEFAGKVRIEAFGADGYEDIYCALCQQIYRSSRVCA